MFDSLLSRHDGHEQKAEGYYRANDDIVKYGYWVLVLLVVSVWSFQRLYKTVSRGRAPNASKEELREQRLSENYGLAAPVRYRLAIAHAMKTLRSYSYPRLASSSRWTRFFTPPTLGQCVLLALYWAIVLAGLWTNVFFKSPSELYGIRWEVVGFRAAWVSTTQLPLLYVTGCRINLVSLLTGVTHERLNWFHRWVARTVFMTLIVHWAFFYREWDIAGFVRQEFKIMPMIIWGFAAWGAIGLMVLTGFGWFRDRYFEAWLVSHITLAWAVLGLSYTHTHCTTYFVAASAAVMLFDVAGRVLSMLFCHSAAFTSLFWTTRLVYHAAVEILDNDYLLLTIDSPRFGWRAGQHVYMTVPHIRLFQSHPFTLMHTRSSLTQSPNDTLSLIIKSHSGFTKALHKLGSTSTNGCERVFLQGPYGNPPEVCDKQVAVYIATGNRASFTISVMKADVQTSNRLSDVTFHWIIPDTQMISWYREELQQCFDTCQDRSIRLDVRIHLTRAQPSDRAKLLSSSVFADSDNFSIGRTSGDSDRSSETAVERKEYTGPSDPLMANGYPLENMSFTGESSSPTNEKQLPNNDDESAPLRTTHVMADETSSWLLSADKQQGCDFSISHGRPSVDEMIRPSIADNRGGVAVVAAVPSVLAADVARVVSRLLKRGDADVELWIEENGS